MPECHLCKRIVEGKEEGMYVKDLFSSKPFGPLEHIRVFLCKPCFIKNYTKIYKEHPELFQKENLQSSNLPTNQIQIKKFIKK